MLTEVRPRPSAVKTFDIPQVTSGLVWWSNGGPKRSLISVSSNPHNLRLGGAPLGCRIHEPVHDLRVAGEDQHLIRFG